ncbi:cytochrome P450 [Flavobacteriaceae bacterium M23B6Z8]
MFTDFCRFLEENKNEYGDFYQYKGLMNFYFVNKPEEAKRILIGTNKDFSKKTKLTRGMHNVLGESIIISDFEQWKPRRRLMNPFFTKKNSLSMFSLMKMKIAEVIEEVEEATNTETPTPYNIYHLFNDLIIRIIGHAFFNKSMQEDVKNIENWLNTMRDYAKNPPLPILSHPNAPTPSNIRMKKARSAFLSYVNDIIKERQESKEEYNDLLGKILSLASETEEHDITFDENDMIMEVMNTIIAGHETTANTIGWLLLILSRNQDKYDKLQREIDEAFGKEYPSSKRVMELEYLDWCIKEAMRLIPPAWVLTRRNFEDITLSDTHIKKDSTLIFCPRFIHRDPRYWENPNEFMPERFSPDNAHNLHPDAYMPFGGGQRFCIGMHFAMVEMKITLAMMLQKFRFIEDPTFKEEPIYSITTYPLNGIKMKILKRRL